MARRIVFAFLLLVLAAPPRPLFAQPSPSVVVEIAPEGATQEIRLRDGTTSLGRVTAIDGDTVTFVTRGGATMTVQRSAIAALAVVGGRADRTAFWKDDPNPTRLFFGPTARPLRAGEVYLGVYEVVMPFVQVGVTDRISVGGGTPLVFGGGGGRPFWFTPKATLVRRPRTQVAVGAMHVANLDGDSLGIVYGAATHGTRDSALTIGAGYAYARYEDNGAPVVMIGGEHRVHRSLKLVSENYVFEGGGIASAGVRFMTGRLSADLGLAAPLGAGEFFVFPMVNFVWSMR